MTKLEREQDEQTETNEKNLKAVLDRTEHLITKIQTDNQKTVENITKQVEELTTKMVDKDCKRNKAQVKQEKEREKALGKKD